MTKVEREIIHWGELLFERRLVSGWGGNLSCRIGKNQFLITGQHAPLGFLTPGDLVRINQDGKPAMTRRKASSETTMHMAVYAGTEAQAIIHVHPPMVVAFSLAHENFVPISFEEKYTIGEVPIIAQDTPTVTKPENVVGELRYHPIVILKGHGTVAIGKNLQEAFLLTDLLEEAVHCQFFKESVSADREATTPARKNVDTAALVTSEKRYELFSKEHMTALIDAANHDAQFRAHGVESSLTTSLTLYLEDTAKAWTVKFVDGEISELNSSDNGEFLISGKAQWWNAVFSNRIDAFLATQLGKLHLKRGELAHLSRWYKPFQRAFALWQRIPVQ
jgi:L-fuculose-phosphate aldolase